MTQEANPPVETILSWRGSLNDIDQIGEKADVGHHVSEPLDRVGTDISITKTCPCSIQRFFTDVKVENFTRKK